jgi:hypothetical protein
MPSAIAPMIPADNPALSARSITEMINRVPLDTVVGTLQKLLDATQRDGFPDWRARTDGIKLWLSYVIGLPVQRQEIVTHKLTSAKPTAAMLANPETRAMLRRLLDDADKGKATDVESE